jgi:hypothetical protein
MGITRIPVSESTRDEVLKPRKRGDDTYDDVIQRLAGADDTPTPDATATIKPELDTEAVDDIANSIVESRNFQGAVTEDEAERILGRLDDLEARLPSKVAEELQR